MNNKGFTLIEIIIVLALLAIMTIIVSTNMVGLSNKQNAKEYERNIESITNATKTYVGLNTANSKTNAKNSGSININLSTLITAGFIDDNLLDSRNDEKIPLSSIVNVKYAANEFSYCFKEETSVINKNSQIWNCEKNKLVDK